METVSNRRNFLKIGAGAAGAAAISVPVARALAATCGLTPPQTQGPFYPGETQFQVESDLTVVPGRPARALGQVVYVKGRVLDSACQPLEGANVEIWQACASGKYNNPRDPNPAPLDPNFRYWGEAYTDAKGEYLFKTIVPGAYPAADGWVRPPHIHFKITKLGFQDLVTQMYFAGDSLNDQDLILQQIPASERNSVIVEFTKVGAEFEPGALIGDFDITLRSVRG